MTQKIAIEARQPALESKIKAALKAKGMHYKPRTVHLNSDGSPIYTNRLILEASPYLLQHAHNPVDWYAWGDEAFKKAKKENKPIFLSIGYSTCHWCHVMERESFENPQIAEWINRYFIPIKVDREQRPDIDEIYMTGVMVMTGRGGWPMSSFITPEGKTFYAGTYYPPNRFLPLLKQIQQIWLKDEKGLRAQADKIAQLVSEITNTHEQATQFDNALFDQAVKEILDRYDDFQGGFSEAPKFPNEPLLYYGLNRLERQFNKALQSALFETLKAMANGGIYDQVGGGFHRYSTDNGWLVPHFEKMLYNQAHLARNYLNAWRLSGNPTFKRITEKTLDYVLRDMQAPLGGFYSATDADTDEEEGLYFTWTIDELKQVLNPKEVALVIELYQVTETGNFEGRNILALDHTLEQSLVEHQIPLQKGLLQIDQIHKKLDQARKKRASLLRDNKILTAWNGMMISALAQAGQNFKSSRYTKAAIKAGDFIWQQLRINKQLKRAYLDGKAAIPASQEDYAYLAEAFIYLYNNTLNPLWLHRAVTLTDEMITLFWDKEKGGFFMSAKIDQSNSMGRPKDSNDNAIPSGNAVALHVFTLLSKRTGNLDYPQKAQKMLALFASKLKKMPIASAYLLMAAENLRYGEMGTQQFAAKGAIQIKSTLKENKLILSFHLQPKWHINSSKPLQSDLIATKLTIEHLDSKHLDIQYPVAEIQQLGYSKAPLSLYQNQFDIRAQLPSSWLKKQGAYFKVHLKLQACNDQSCLAPETLSLTILNHPWN